MIVSMSFIACTFIFTLVIMTVYIFKKHVKNIETKIYNYTLALSVVNLTIEFLLCINIVLDVNIYSFYNLFLNRLFLISLFSWFTIFSIYVVCVSETVKINKKSIIKFLIYYLIIISLLIILPIELVNENGAAYSTGIVTYLLYVICGLYSLLWLIIIVFKRKILGKKAIPFLFFLICFVVMLILRAYVPSILLNSFSSAFATILMFFTIENPDLKLIAELNIAKDQAEKANNAKTDFLSSMSHEIRTPLNAIVGFSNGLLEDEMPIQAKEDVKNIISSSNSLLEIVNGILDISKIEANKLEIINTNYNFDNLFNELVNLAKSRIGDKKIDFQYKYDPSIPKYLYGDEVRLKQIILNLLTNSAKYTTKGHIYFNISSLKNNNNIRLIISVEDTGLGIKEEHINKLFSKFERLGVERNTTAEGTGLGLAITKKLVELMHGKIFLQSLYGVGSRFTILIDQALISSEEYEKLEAIYTETLVTETLNANGKKILVVDDNSMNLKVAERLLKKYNVNVELVSSGFECIDIINSGAEYDLILMDDMMPKMSGVETYKKLRENSNFKIPTVVLTANAISGMREKYLAEGFYDYLSKPIEKEELSRVLKKYLS